MALFGKRPKREHGLTEDGRFLLRQGLAQWGGPCDMTDALAVALGYEDATHFSEEADRIRRALDSGEQLDKADARRALEATEIAFVSDTLGAACCWETVTGLTDEETLRTLRKVQFPS
jgi:hypothetical protein